MNKCHHPGCDRNPCYDDAAWHMQIEEHTQTPWHIELGLKEYSIWGGKTSREIDRVATLCGDKDFDPVANANALFIITACNNYKELLKTAKAVMDTYYDRQIEDEYLHAPMSRLCDAISKAEGK